MRNSGRVGFTEAALHLGVSERLLRRLVFEKRVPHYKLGGGARSPLLFSTKELDDWLEEHRVQVDPRHDVA